MAQHVELLNCGDCGSKIINKDVEHVVSSIKNDFAKGLSYIRGSFRYKSEDWLINEYLKGGEKNIVVFSTRKRMHFEDDKNLDVYVLEIHYNEKNKKITHIYVVI